MKIFFIPTSYPDLQYPQKDIFIYEQAKELARRGHEIVVLHVKKLPTKYFFSKVRRDVELIDDGFAKRFVVKQKTIFEGRYPGLNRNRFVDSVKILFENAISKFGTPDVIYSHFSCWAGYAASLLSKEYNIPLVAIEHYGGYLKENINSQLKLALNNTISQASAFICVSENLKGRIIKLLPEERNIEVISNMIDRQFKYVPEKEQKNFVFSSIGNLNPGKDFSILIKAFSLAFKPTDNVVLRIGGGGPEKEKLQKLISSLGREKQIQLLGRLTRKQTIEEYINCNVFALASRFETFGMVYREALVTGRPVVTTNHGGFSANDWHDEYGSMVPVQDLSSLVNALVNIYNNYRNYNGKEISEICLKDCSADIIGDKIEIILLTAAKSK